MSETKDIRTILESHFWGQREKVNAAMKDIDALQSPPAPTDLLLTDEFIHDLEQIFSSRVMTETQRKEHLKILFSKLQQARPTEQAREKLASVIFIQGEWVDAGVGENITLTSKGITKLLRLLPDEQAIEKRVRKEIGEWLIKYKFISKQDWNIMLRSVQSGQKPEDK